MNNVLITGGLLLAWTCANPAWADDAKSPAAAPTTPDEKGATPSNVYESSYEQIIRDCGVTDKDNKEKIHELLKNWDVETMQVTASAAPVDPNLTAKLEQLDRDLANATEKTDANMVRDLSAKRLIILDAMGGWGSDAKKMLEDLDTKYQTAVKELVPADKAEVLGNILATAQDTLPNRPRRAPVRSPRALRAIVDRLGDLTPEQQAGIDGAFLRHREAQRAPGARPGNEAEQVKRLYDDVFAVLTDGQKTRVEQQLIGRKPGTPETPAVRAAPNPGAASTDKPATDAKTPPAKNPVSEKP